MQNPEEATLDTAEFDITRRCSVSCMTYVAPCVVAGKSSLMSDGEPNEQSIRLLGVAISQTSEIRWSPR